MIVLDASVALKWFVDGEPLVAAAQRVLADVARDSAGYVVPELFMNEVLAVLTRVPGATVEQVREALSLLESLGIARIGNGHELLSTAAELALRWRLSGYDAVYVAAALLVKGTWLTADRRAARRVRQASLVRVLTA